MGFFEPWCNNCKRYHAPGPCLENSKDIDGARNQLIEWLGVVKETLGD
jgi:hypothetical protein